MLAVIEFNVRADELKRQAASPGLSRRRRVERVRNTDVRPTKIFPVLAYVLGALPAPRPMAMRLTPVTCLPSLSVRPLAFHALGADRSAVTLAIMMAAQGRDVILTLERQDWLEAIADGEMPFDAPTLLPLLRRALRAERLTLVAPASARVSS